MPDSTRTAACRTRRTTSAAECSRAPALIDVSAIPSPPASLPAVFFVRRQHCTTRSGSKQRAALSCRLRSTGIRSMRLRILACLATGLLACIDAVAQAPAAAPEESSVGLYFVETPDLKLIYFDQLGYLAPYAVRTFTNSLAWQRQRFGWKPSEASTVLLKDFSDYGSAATWAAPRNTAVLRRRAAVARVRDLSRRAERMYSLMNHELVHVATNDIANEQDRRWRRFFRGKVAPQTRQPGIAALQLPDGAALHSAALVARRQRGLHGNLDGRRRGPRAGRLRRDGVPRDGARRRAFLRSARPRVARRARRLPGRARTPTCTARAS